MNEHLKEKSVCYVCITTTQFKKDAIEEIRSSKIYEDMLDGYYYLFNDGVVSKKHSDIEAHGHIMADVIVGPNRRRWALEELINTFKNGNSWFESPKGVIIINNLSMLGTQPQIASMNYLRLVKEDIGIFILDKEQSFFSTVEIDGNYRSDITPLEREQLGIQIVDIKLKSSRGKKKAEIDFSSPKWDDWKDIYWLYESFKIPESLVYNNKLLKTTHNTFDRNCTAYEKSPVYALDEQRIPDIYDIPKRHGRITKEMSAIFEGIISGQISERDACEKLKLSPITLHRYILKGTTRSNLTKAFLNLTDEKIIRKLTPTE